MGSPRFIPTCAFGLAANSSPSEFHDAVTHADLRLRTEVGSLVRRLFAHGQTVLERLHARPLNLLLKPWS